MSLIDQYLKGNAPKLHEIILRLRFLIFIKDAVMVFSVYVIVTNYFSLFSAVCKIYSGQKAIRVKQAVDRQKLLVEIFVKI